MAQSPVQQTTSKSPLVADLRYLTHTGVALELELIGIGKVSRNDELNRAAAH